MSHWIEKANIYHIYPLGFCGCERFNKEVSETPVNRIKKVIDWIPHIKSMNMNTIYFGPVFESVEHGYDTNDYLTIDKRLGTNNDFKEVCKALHENGIRVVLDGVFNHVGRDFFAFKDLCKNGQSSQYKDWFAGVNFNSKSPYGDNFSYEGWNGYYNLVKLNLSNRDVVSYLLSAVKIWIDEFNIDGIRFDAADCLSDGFIKSICRFTRDIKSDFWLMGEIIHGDYKRWANKEMFDSVTNYQCYKGIYSSHNDRNYFEIAHSIEYQYGQFGQLYLYNFLDNHDVSRIMSILKNPEHAECCYTMMYMIYGVPSVYYGSELGIKGDKGKGNDADLPVRPCLSLNDIKSGNQKLLAHISALGAIRTKNTTVQSGSYSKMELKNQTFLFKREKDGNQVYIALNISDGDYVFSFQTLYSNLTDLLSGKSFTVKNGKAEIKVPKNVSMILSCGSSDTNITDEIEAEVIADPVNSPEKHNDNIKMDISSIPNASYVPNGRKIIIGGHYKHFKGGDYVVLHVAQDHENCEKQVVYMALCGKPVIWVRPLNMFLEDVNDHGNIKPRFSFVEDN